MNYLIPANSTQSLGFPILRSAVLVGAVTAGDANSISLDGITGVQSLLISGNSYFLEVVGHIDGITTANVGERFELNEASSSGAVVALDTASSLNTSSGNFSSLIGYRVAVRPHWTLKDLFGTGTSATLNSGTTFSTADQVLAWTGTSWSTYWFRQNSAGSVKEWRNIDTGTANQDSVIIPSGVGVYFRRGAGALNLTLVGEVRSNRFIRNLDSSTQLVAQGFPVDRAPLQLGFDFAGGFASGTTFGTADQLLVWTGSAFSTYWYRQNSTGTTREWRNIDTGTTVHSNTSFLSASQAIFVKPLATSPNDVVQNVPFSL